MATKNEDDNKNAPEESAVDSVKDAEKKVQEESEATAKEEAADAEVSEAEAPEADAEAPEADAEAPEADAEAPEADAEASEADAEASEADAEASEADAEAPEADAEASHDAEDASEVASDAEVPSEAAGTGSDVKGAPEEATPVAASGDGNDGTDGDLQTPSGPDELEGMAAFFDLPDELMHAAASARIANYKRYDAYSPFPIHGMDDAMGLGRSWLPWVTFGAGTGGFLTANVMQFGIYTFDWPMIIGGKPFAPWPSFVPIMFELTVLLAGVTTAVVMLIAAGCFRKPLIIDPEITNDRFVLWISADDEAFEFEKVRTFMESLNPVEIKTIKKGA